MRGQQELRTGIASHVSPGLAALPHFQATATVSEAQPEPLCTPRRGGDIADPCQSARLGPLKPRARTQIMMFGPE